jgi:hypothetical protein
VAVAAALGIGADYGAYNRRQGIKTEAAALTGGDPNRAPALMVKYGCVGCHTIPGVPRAIGRLAHRTPAVASDETIATND